MTRIRLFYEKRGFACFVPHVALSTLFARAARRAGLELSKTEGFSARAKISFGPELPAGVVALNEPADLWLKDAEEKEELGKEEIGREVLEKRREFLGSLPEIFNAQMPEGFRVKKCVLPGDGALGKECGAACYLLWTGNGLRAEELLAHMERHYGEAVLSGVLEAEETDEAGKISRVRAVLANPAQNGIGGWVKALTADGLAAGWSDMRVVRTGLGRWNGERMEPMEEAVSRFGA